MGEVGDAFKSIGKIALSIGGAVLGSAIMPGAGTALGSMGGAALGGGLGGMAGNALGSAIIDQEAPSALGILTSGAAGAAGGALGHKTFGRSGALGTKMFGTPSSNSTVAPTSLPGGMPTSIDPKAASGISPDTAAILAAMKGSSPTTKQLAIQAGIGGAVPALATLGSSMLSRGDGPKEYKYEGGATNYLDEIRARRERRNARSEKLRRYYG